jgi:methylated-DNA-[protein]-cysteine S-methyltransferase
MSTRNNSVTVFHTPLGWMALVVADEVLRQLAFGYDCSDAALEALSPALAENAKPGSRRTPLVDRLQAYAEGATTDLSDIRIDPGPLGAFQRRVVEHCRRIPYGQTLTYGQLAAKAGSPGAARAVGNCMAANRIPLVIPCHRVVPAGGRLGGFSAPGGELTKKRLLALEAVRLYPAGRGEHAAVLSGLAE